MGLGGLGGTGRTGRPGNKQLNKYLLMITRIIAAAVTMAFAAAGWAQSAGEPNDKYLNMKWTRMADNATDSFMTTAEAARIGDNLLFYQHDTGGWPKNMKLQQVLTEEKKREAERLKRGERYATIDNKATTTEMKYLARLYKATGKEKYRKAVERGFGYLLEAQYDNGGWPQFYPLSEGYYTHITYNDDAMINVMKTLRDAWRGKEPYTFLGDSLRSEAGRALYRGVDCILKTQVVQDGRKTVWCAQHDEHTLLPANARAYELASLSGAESDDIVLFLMSLPHPSAEIRKCVEDAVAWFKKSMITGLRFEWFTNADGKKDYRMAPCPQDAACEPLWARFYTIEDNRPFFCDRDGVKRYDVSEIGYERRNGYSWYNSNGTEVIEKYERWKEKAERAESNGRTGRN